MNEHIVEIYTPWMHTFGEMGVVWLIADRNKEILYVCCCKESEVETRISQLLEQLNKDDEEENV